ncbi:hypothetical protein lacNasYZ03_08630 [Lactobacillus nasalidis]|uniref:Uncharacterized protein n=1 Tax=Lactobacillus nasalidis TaxID=2797258 RepID=A0ABQ3W6M8_9LACO|nr:hypothetical protein [Lactobacillus nasalidis]GHV97034.1 hypothetical protein lacNasYZ01_02160 [Lactobacillus nasalidis]GHW00263.1 hypothetical protein lacNasYZ02_16920 [Lactobacillus nasalidis]GHW01176.1 hypothetical protein lacNasYZ03_08630 [Lactobacillus nasalidis]
MINPDFAIILNFNPTAGKVNADALVRRARDIGARAVSGPDALQEACEKYTIARLPKQDGKAYGADEVVDALTATRKAGQALVVDVAVNADGEIAEDAQASLEALNSWMHKFGHAANEGQPSTLAADATDSFVLTNRHAPYQAYLFLKAPYPAAVKVTGLTEEPNRVEWIDGREECDFVFEQGVLTVQLKKQESPFAWQLVRIQGHRPEDDLTETKF